MKTEIQVSANEAEIFKYLREQMEQRYNEDRTRLARYARLIAVSNGVPLDEWDNNLWELQSDGYTAVLKRVDTDSQQEQDQQGQGSGQEQEQ